MAASERTLIWSVWKENISSIYEASSLPKGGDIKKLILNGAEHYLEIIARLAASSASHDNFMELKLYAGRLGTWAEGFFAGEDLPQKLDFSNALKRNAIVPGFSKLDTLLGTIPNSDPTGSQPISLLDAWSWETAIMAHQQCYGTFANFLDVCARNVFATPPFTLSK